MYGKMVKIYGMVNIHKMEHGNWSKQNLSTFGSNEDRATGRSSNMEMESHNLGTPNLRGRKNTIYHIYCLNLFFNDQCSEQEANYTINNKKIYRQVED